MKKRLVFFCVVAVYSAFVGMASSVNSASYDEPTAIKAVYLSAAAYCREPLITAWNCSFCKEQFPQFQLRAPVFYGVKTDSQAFVGYAPSLDTIMVGIRGTASITDWIDDIEADKTPPGATGLFPSDIEIHTGFYNVYMELVGQGFRDAILDAVNAYPDSKIMVSGHSLGASIATLVAADMGYNYNMRTDNVITFGEPRLGTPAFASWYPNQVGTHWRVTHHRDVIPHVPLKMMGYHHVSTEIFYAAEDYHPDDYHVCDGSGEDPDGIDSLFGDEPNDHLHYLGLLISRMCDGQ
jgi:hypothetical protein